jgi:hypothetical protein
MLQDPRESRTAPSWAETKAREDSTPILLPLVEPGLRPCELRWERSIEGDGSGGVEVVCMAAGGKRLAVKGGDEREMPATCGSCTIPMETARRPCLYLVPIKTERDHKVRDYFICRWFYRLKPEQPATTTSWMCVGCIYWFPRPPLNMLKDYEKATHKMIEYHQDAWAGRLPPSPFSFRTWQWSPTVPRWKRLWCFLVSLLSGWWGLSQPKPGPGQ